MGEPTRKRKIIIEKYLNYLSVEFVPPREKILHRENHIRRIMTRLEYVFKGAKPINLVFSGDIGTGKTVVARIVTEHFERNCREKGLNIKCLYVNCNRWNTKVGIVRNLIEQMGDVKGSRKGRLAGKYFDIFHRHCLKHNYVIVTLDEFDKAIAKSSEDFDSIIYEFTRLIPNVTLILITNDLKARVYIDRDMEIRARDTFRYDPITFDPYEPFELVDILHQRVELALYPDTWDMELLADIANISYAADLGARGLIDITRLAAELAEKEGADRIYPRHVRAATPEAFKLRQLEELDGLLPQHLLILAILSRAPGRELPKDRLYEYFNSNVKRQPYLRSLYTEGRVNEQWFRRYLQKLETRGLIQRWVKGRGKGKGVETRVRLDPDFVVPIEKVLERRFVKRSL